jgi:hypothetical protein
MNSTKPSPENTVQLSDTGGDFLSLDRLRIFHRLDPLDGEAKKSPERLIFPFFTSSII